MARLDVLHAHALPVEQIAKSLCAVTLVDALTLALLCEVEHVLGKLVDAVVDTLQSTVDNVDAVVLSILNQLLHVATEAGQVGGDRWHTHDSALGGSVTPGFVVRAEDTHVGATNEVVVIDGKHGVGRAQELGVEDNLDAVRRLVEKLAASDLVENGIFAVVGHVVCNDGRKSVALHGEKAAAEHDLVLCREKVLVVWWRLALPPCERLLEQLLANVALNVSHSIVQALDHGLTLQCLHGERGSLSRHDDESNDCHVGASRLHAVVQASQRLDKHIHTLIPVLVTSGSEEVQRLVRIEVIVPIEMTADKVVDALLVGLVQVLELVSCAELLDIETVGQNTVGLALEQVLALVGGDVGDGCKDIGGMCCAAFDAVAVVDTSLARLGVAVKVLQVVVEIDRTGAEVAAEKGSVSGEDGGHIDLALLTQGESNTRKPLVELCDNGSFLLVVDILQEMLASEPMALLKGCICSPRPKTMQSDNRRR